MSICLLGLCFRRRSKYVAGFGFRFFCRPVFIVLRSKEVTHEQIIYSHFDQDDGIIDYFLCIFT